MPYPGDVIDKDPSADLPYEMDWTAWLAKLSGAATLLSSIWEVSGADAALTADSAIILTGDKITQVWLHGGTPGVVYTVTNRVTASGSPTPKDDRSFYVHVKQR